MSQYNTTLDDINKSISTIIDILINDNNYNDQNENITNNDFLDETLDVKIYLIRADCYIHDAVACYKKMEQMTNKIKKFNWMSCAIRDYHSSASNFKIASELTACLEKKEEYISKAIKCTTNAVKIANIQL
jgi:hypothetical protein